MEDEKSDSQSSFQKAYGWYIVVNRVTGNDFTKHEIVYKSKILEVLNQLSFLIDYDREQERLRKQAQSGF